MNTDLWNQINYTNMDDPPKSRRHPIKKPLTEREFDVAMVAGDLLMKGSPERRIALHCVHKGLNRKQTETLMLKLVAIAAIKPTTATKVIAEYPAAAMAAPDERFREGEVLKRKVYAERIA